MKALMRNSVGSWWMKFMLQKLYLTSQSISIQSLKNSHSCDVLFQTFFLLEIKVCGRRQPLHSIISTSFIRKSAFFWNILKSGKIGFFSTCLNTETLKKSVSGHFSVFQTYCNFPDVFCLFLFSILLCIFSLPRSSSILASFHFTLFTASENLIRLAPYISDNNLPIFLFMKKHGWG